MEEGNLISVRCSVLVSVLIIAEAQTFSDSDGNPEDVSSMPGTRSSTEAENFSWFGMSDYEGNQKMSSSYYPVDLFSSSVLEDSEGRNASLMSSEWVWNPIKWYWWVILQMIAAFMGTVGNLLVIILLFQRRKDSRSTDLLVGALAIADIFTSIFMIPLPSADRVPSTILGQIYCKFVFTSIFFWISVNASIFTLTFIPIERYIAIVYPLRCKEFLSRKKMMTVVALTWSIGFILNIMIVFAITIDPSSNNCSVVYPWKAMQTTIGVVNFATEFLIPSLITLIFQVLTARSLHRQSRLHLGADKRLDRSNPSVRHLIAKRSVLRMLFTVVLIFIVSWGPTQVLYLAYNLKLIGDTYLYSPLYQAVNVLAFSNACANPIIYTVRYPEFRKAMKDFFTPSKRNTAPLFDDRVSKSQALSIRQA